MAVKYSDIKTRIQNPEFTKEELKAVEEIETFIDNRINEEFDNSPLHFDLPIINFDRVLNRGSNIDFKSTRKKLMRAEIDSRYTKAGWLVKVDYENMHWTISER